MAETLSNGYPQQTHNFEPLFCAVDPMSLLLSQNSFSADQPTLAVIPTTDLYFAMERGPRYKAYAERRERKLRMKLMRQHEEPNTNQTPPRKQVKFQRSSIKNPKAPSFLAQSVPNFASMMRKENQKPNTNNMLSPLLEMTPPTTKKSTKGNFGSSIVRGSKSVNAGEKRGGGMMVRKSYACVQELKGLSSMAASSIAGGDNKTSTRNSTRASTRKSVMGSTQYYL